MRVAPATFRRVSTPAFVVLGLLVSESAMADRAAPAPIEVEATLLDAGASVPACGRVHAVSVAQFRLVRTIRGTMPDSTFWIAYSCSSVQRTEVGLRFLLSLSPTRTFAGGAIFWPHGQPVQPLYWGVGRERLPSRGETTGASALSERP